MRRNISMKENNTMSRKGPSIYILIWFGAFKYSIHDQLPFSDGWDWVAQAIWAWGPEQQLAGGGGGDGVRKYLFRITRYFFAGQSAVLGTLTAYTIVVVFFHFCFHRYDERPNIARVVVVFFCCFLLTFSFSDLQAKYYVFIVLLWLESLTYYPDYFSNVSNIIVITPCICMYLASSFKYE